MKHKVFILVLLLAAMVMPHEAHAYQFSATAPSGQILYYNISNGQAVVTSQNTSYPFNYAYPSGNLIIPSSVTYNGITYSVSSIGDNAFWNCSALTSITISDGITTIGSAAFSGCDGLISIIIPNSVTSISIYAFDGCSGLTSVAIPDGVTSISAGAFNGCSGLNSVTTGNGITSIGNFAFFNCINLTSITIPDSVTFIGNQAFYNCFSLTSITILDGVSFIGHSAFYGCNSLTSVNIPDGVTSINNSTFSGCSNLSSVTIPEGVTSIGYSAFVDCSGLTSIIIPDDVISIGDQAFYHCSNLSVVTIGKGVNSIGNDAFSYCDSLTVMWMKPITPPVTENNLYFCNNSINLIVPRASYAAYNNAGTRYTIHNIYPDSVFVTVNINDTTRGYAVGCDSIYANPVQCTISAIPNYGYHFASWEDNTTDSIRILSGFMQDPVLAAYFDYNQYAIALSTDTSIHGMVTGAGSYNYLSERAITANAYFGYHFTHWSDGDTNNPRTITLTRDTSFTAFFDKNRYCITVLSPDTLRGTAYGSDTAYYLDTMTVIAVANYGYTFYRWEGTRVRDEYQNTSIFYGDTLKIALTGEIVLNAIFLPDTFNIMLSVDTSIHGTVDGTGMYSYLSDCIISANANYGYHFTQWNDGNTDNPRTIILTQDTLFVAMFAKNTYTLVFLSNNSSIGVIDTTSISGKYLDTSILIHATATPHYHFLRWSDYNTENPRRFVFYDNHTYTAYFAIDTHTVSVHTNDISGGMVEATGTEFVYGTPCTVTATAYSGYTFVRWSNGATYNPYTFAVLGDVELTAIFESLEGIDGADTLNAKIYQRNGQVVVEGAESNTVTLYDVTGRVLATKQDNDMLLHFDAPATGTYMIKIGNYPARKVVVVR